MRPKGSGKKLLAKIKDCKNETTYFNIPIFLPPIWDVHLTVYTVIKKRISSTMNAPNPEDIKEIVDKHLATIPPYDHIEIAFFGGSFTAIAKEAAD